MAKDEHLNYLADQIDDITISSLFYEEVILDDHASAEHMDEAKMDAILDMQKDTGLPIEGSEIQADVNEYMEYEIYVRDVIFTSPSNAIAGDVYEKLMAIDDDFYQPIDELSLDAFISFYKESNHGRQAIYDALWEEYTSNRSYYEIEHNIYETDVIEYIKENHPDWYADVQNEQ